MAAACSLAQRERWGGPPVAIWLSQVPRRAPERRDLHVHVHWACTCCMCCRRTTRGGGEPRGHSIAGAVLACNKWRERENQCVVRELCARYLCSQRTRKGRFTIYKWPRVQATLTVNRFVGGEPPGIENLAKRASISRPRRWVTACLWLMKQEIRRRVQTGSCKRRRSRQRACRPAARAYARARARRHHPRVAY